MNKLDYNSSINQEIKRHFVSREVFYCASYLVSELAKNDEYMDEFLPVLTQDNYEDPALEFLNNEITVEQCRDYLDGQTTLSNDFDKISLKRLKYIIQYHIVDNYQEFCEFFDIEPYQIEAYEHWIISDWLAKRLEEQGQMVIYDFMGFTIWGRTCTGQAILLDGVISSICEDMEILDGQKSSWAPAKNTEPDIKRIRQIRDALNKTKNREKLEKIAAILDI